MGAADRASVLRRERERVLSGASFVDKSIRRQVNTRSDVRRTHTHTLSLSRYASPSASTCAPAPTCRLPPRHGGRSCCRPEPPARPSPSDSCICLTTNHRPRTTDHEPRNTNHRLRTVADVRRTTCRSNPVDVDRKASIESPSATPSPPAIVLVHSAFPPHTIFVIHCRAP